MSLFRGLLDDAGLITGALADRVLPGYRRHRGSWYAEMIGPLVVPDTELARIGRIAEQSPEAEPVEVSVLNTGGAGGLIALTRRAVPGVRLVAVESPLRDLDDLAANAARVAAAAAELDPEIEVFVELPAAPGWERAVEEVEAAGMSGKIRVGHLDPSLRPAAGTVAEQMSTLVEADLAFKAGGVRSGSDLLALMTALEALIEGATPAEATALLTATDPEQIPTRISSWDEPTRQRVRRRLRRVECHDVAAAVDELTALGQLLPPGGAT